MGRGVLRSTRGNGDTWRDALGFFATARLMRRLRVQRATTSILVASELCVFFWSPHRVTWRRGRSDQSSMASKSWTRRGLGDGVLPGLQLLPKKQPSCHWWVSGERPVTIAAESYKCQRGSSLGQTWQQQSVSFLFVIVIVVCNNLPVFLSCSEGGEGG